MIQKTYTIGSVAYCVGSSIGGAVAAYITHRPGLDRKAIPLLFSRAVLSLSGAVATGALSLLIANRVVHYYATSNRTDKEDQDYGMDALVISYCALNILYGIALTAVPLQRINIPMSYKESFGLVCCSNAVGIPFLLFYVILFTRGS